ncbi:uncharacterized protein LOC129290570 [Prosopis cineraria]|uniref:uncharacterized protein LOC129290570 n=1 Tax=Prosopis cineraria TaxID=364024 RepID=UPI00240FC9C2|nr:uncharacterized protein LOC129290570 [Prosopis cineraria]
MASFSGKKKKTLFTKKAPLFFFSEARTFSPPHSSSFFLLVSSSLLAFSIRLYQASRVGFPFASRRSPGSLCILDLAVFQALSRSDSRSQRHPELCVGRSRLWFSNPMFSALLATVLWNIA